MMDADSLIDFIDDNEYLMKPQQALLTTTTHPAFSHVSPHSFDNNPFDSISHLASMQNNPFDAAAIEASAKAAFAINNTNVIEGNLLSLDDSNNHGEPLAVNGNGNDETSWTPPQMPNNANDSPFDIDGLMSSSTTSSGENNRANKYAQHRNKLLKLSVTNSTFNSPISRQIRRQTSGEMFAENDSAWSPISSLKSAMVLSNESMLESESPLKLTDGLLDASPVTPYGEQDFDAELRLLDIPMLKLLTPTPMNESCRSAPADADATPSTSGHAAHPSPMFDLSALRAKLAASREHKKSTDQDSSANASNMQDVDQLAQHLHSFVYSYDFGDDTNKKEKVASLIETLASTLSSGNAAKQKNDANHGGQNDSNMKHKDEDGMPPHEWSAGGTAVPATKSLGIERIPDVMISSSATYDCETAEEKAEVDDLVEQMIHVLDFDDNRSADSCNERTQRNEETCNASSITALTTNSVVDAEMSNMGDASSNRSNSVRDQSNLSSLGGNSTNQALRSAAVPDVDEFYTPERKVIRRYSCSSITPRSRTIASRISDGQNHRSLAKENAFQSFGSRCSPLARWRAQQNELPSVNPRPRRSSFSSAMRPVTGASNAMDNRSILGKGPASRLMPRPLSPPANKKAKLVELQQDSLKSLQADMKKRKMRASTASVLNPAVPLKATIPMNRAISSKAGEMPTPTTTRTASQLRSKLADARSSGRNLPSACSTPQVPARTPQRRQSMSTYPAIASTMRTPSYAQPKKVHIPATPQTKSPNGWKQKTAANAGIAPGGAVHKPADVPLRDNPFYRMASKHKENKMPLARK